MKKHNREFCTTLGLKIKKVIKKPMKFKNASYTVLFTSFLTHSGVFSKFFIHSKSYAKLCNFSLFFLLMFCFVVHAQKTPKWVDIGKGTYQAGFVYPYKLKLSVPYGVRNIQEIKEGLIPLKFELTWLPSLTTKKEIETLFKNQLEQKFDSIESFKLSKNLIARLLRKLPETHRHEQWVFEYYPDIGTKLFIKETKIYHLVGAELNRALIDSWINKSPVLTANLFNRLLKLQ